MNKTRKGIVAFLLAAVLLISMVGMASASRHWDLDSNGIMYEGLHSEQGSITIDLGTSYVWRSEISYEGFNFPPWVWDGRLTTNEDLEGMYTAEIGYCNVDRTGFETAGYTEGGGQYIYDSNPTGNTGGASFYLILINEFTVPDGKYIAFKVTNTGKDPSFTVATDSSSYLTQWEYVGDTPKTYIDIKPESCPNAFNPKRGGVMSVAVLGTGDFDVKNIDPTTILLEGVVPLRWNYEDVATPFEGELCDCHEEGADGIVDLVLKFKNQDLTNKLGLMNEAQNTYIQLTLTGELNDGTSFEAQDCIWINKAKK